MCFFCVFVIVDASNTPRLSGTTIDEKSAGVNIFAGRYAAGMHLTKNVDTYSNGISSNLIGLRARLQYWDGSRFAPRIVNSLEAEGRALFCK